MGYYIARLSMNGNVSESLVNEQDAADLTLGFMLTHEPKKNGDCLILGADGSTTFLAENSDTLSLVPLPDIDDSQLQ